MKAGFKCFAITAYLLLLSNIVYAEGFFSHRGFKQGMSIKEAKIKAKLNHGNLQNQRDDNEFIYYEFIIGGDKNSPTMLYFCKSENGLYRIDYLVSGGFQKYIKLIESFKIDYNFKIVDTFTRLYLAYDGTEHAKMTNFLRKEISSWFIEMNLYSNENYGTTNSQIAYEVINRKSFCSGS
jgi:hypothetical protein